MDKSFFHSTHTHGIVQNVQRFSLIALFISFADNKLSQKLLVSAIILIVVVVVATVAAATAAVRGTVIDRLVRCTVYINAPKVLVIGEFSSEIY